MSIEAMRAVSKCALTPSGRKFVALALADYADEAWECFPQVKAIAAYTAQSERTVREHLDALEAAGVIVRKRVRREDGTLSGYRFAIQQDMLPANLASGENAPVAKSAASGKVNKINPAANLASGENFHNQRRNLPDKIPQGIHQEEEERGGASLALDFPDDLPVSDPPAPEPKRSRRKPEVPIPDDWGPSDRNIADAQSRNLSSEDIRREADRFRDHHLARDTRFRDWDAAWRTWVSRARPGGGGVVVAAFPGRGGPGRSLASIAAQRRLADAN